MSNGMILYPTNDELSVFQMSIENIEYQKKLENGYKPTIFSKEELATFNRCCDILISLCEYVSGYKSLKINETVLG